MKKIMILLMVCIGFALASSVAPEKLDKREAAKRFQNLASQCRREKSFLIENVKAVWMGYVLQDPAAPRPQEMQTLLNEGRIFENVKTQVSPEEWSSIVDAWGKTLEAYAHLIKVGEYKETVIPRPPLETIVQDLAAITTPISLPIMALQHDIHSEEARIGWGLWGLSPLLVIGGAVSLPFDVLAAGPRAIKRAQQRRFISFDESYRAFRESVHQLPGKPTPKELKGIQP